MTSKCFLLSVAVLLLAGCARTPKPDAPRLVPGIRSFDSTVHSALLGRDMPLRIVLPEPITAGRTLPVVVLLHGYAANYSSFSAWSDVDKLATANFILVMPEDRAGFFLNTRLGRYEDYLLTEVLPRVHELVPEASQDPAHRAVVGISRGGFGAIVLALKHPEAFSYAASLSGALEIIDRPFVWSELKESINTQRALGSRGSEVRRANDPMRLLPRSPKPPFFYLAWAKDEDLGPANEAFAKALTTQGVPHTVARSDGDHGWISWSAMYPALQSSLSEHIGAPPQ